MNYSGQFAKISEYSLLFWKFVVQESTYYFLRSLKKVQELLLSGIPINCTENDDTENTLLHVAARYSNKNTVLYLLRKFFSLKLDKIYCF